MFLCEKVFVLVSCFAYSQATNFCMLEWPLKSISLLQLCFVHTHQANNMEWHIGYIGTKSRLEKMKVDSRQSIQPFEINFFVFSMIVILAGGRFSISLLQYYYVSQSRANMNFGTRAIEKKVEGKTRYCYGCYESTLSYACRLRKVLSSSTCVLRSDSVQKFSLTFKMPLSLSSQMWLLNSVLLDIYI